MIAVKHPYGKGLNPSPKYFLQKTGLIKVFSYIFAAKPKPKQTMQQPLTDPEQKVLDDFESQTKSEQTFKVDRSNWDDPATKKDLAILKLQLEFKLKESENRTHERIAELKTELKLEIAAAENRTNQKIAEVKIEPMNELLKSIKRSPKLIKRSPKLKTEPIKK